MNLEEFEEAYRAWRSQPFPRGSSWDPLDELHSHLAYADTMVAELIIPFVERRKRFPDRLDTPTILRDIRERARTLASRASGEDDRKLANEYDDYARRLQVVFEAFSGEGLEA